MSLTGELKELFELYKLGALSEDEFKHAKAKLLGGGAAVEQGPAAGAAPSPSPAPPSSASPQLLADNSSDMSPLYPALAEEITGRFTRLAAAVTLLVQLQQRERTPSAHQARLTAYQHLYTVFTNLAREPDNARFRRLRQTNAVLARELWPVPGCVALLQAIGFVPDTSAPDGTSPSLLPLVVAADVRGADLVDRAQEALSAVVFCRKEMEEQTRRQQVSRGLLAHNVTLEIRLENAQAAMAKGELAGFLAALFTQDDAGDDLFTAREHLREMESLIAAWETAIHATDSDDADVAIDLSDPRWYRAVVRQRGALELLLVGAQATLRELPATLPATPPASHADTCDHTPTAQEACETVAQLVLPAHAPESLAHHRQAADLLGGILAAVEGRRAARQQAAQAQAQAAAALMVRREKKRVQHERDRAAERQAEAGPGPRRRLGAGASALPPTTTAKDSDDSDSDDDSSDDDRRANEETETGPSTRGASATGGKRVPLATALAFLMGKEVDGWKGSDK